MTLQVESGAPVQRIRPVVDDADPMGGRHVFDHDAASTPIFTALRRGGWQRSRPSAVRTLRAVPEPCRSWDDPPTGPIPIVAPPYPAGRLIDPYAPGSFASDPSPVSVDESTAWWSDADTAAVPDPTAGHRPTWYGPSTPYDDHAADDDSAFYDDHTTHRDRENYDDHAVHDHRAAYDGHAPYADRAAHDHHAVYDDPGFRGSYDTGYRDPITDTGRHHHQRLAPAGW